MKIEGDFFGRAGSALTGRYVHDMYLMKEKPSESTKPWDYYKMVKKLPGEAVFHQGREQVPALEITARL